MALAAGIRNNALSAGAKLPNLPVIEHPASRLGNAAELEVCGSSSGRSSTASSLRKPRVLPPMHYDGNNKGHSRVLTWPPVAVQDPKESSFKEFHTINKLTPGELEVLLREKLSTGFHGFRQCFLGNDPTGKGSISREALYSVLARFCGYVSQQQINGLLKRIGLDTGTSITFDDFIRHFKDVEVVQKQWVDPVVRPTLEEEEERLKLPANKLRQYQRDVFLSHREAMLRAGRRRPVPKMRTALQAFPLLKVKLNDGSVNLQDIFPPSCFEDDGLVLKPQLRTALEAAGILMDDYEFEKLWNRIDNQTGLESVDSDMLFRTLGFIPEQELEKLERRPHTSPMPAKLPSPREVVPPIAKSPRVQEIPEAPAEDIPDEDIANVLTEKFREGYHRMHEVCRKYDAAGTGLISREDLKKVLKEFHLHLDSNELDHLLFRCGMKGRNPVPYKEFLDVYLDRSETGLLHDILEDVRHKFNRSRDSCIGNSTAQDAEARILDIFQADFLSILAAFRQLDKHDLGLVKKYQLREILDARFGLRLNREELNNILEKLECEKHDGLVPYVKFLEVFGNSKPVKTVAAPEFLKSSPRSKTSPELKSSSRAVKRVPSPISPREKPASPQKEITDKPPVTEKENNWNPSKSKIPEEETRKVAFTEHLGKLNKDEVPETRKVDKLQRLLKNLLSDHFHSINKAFMIMDFKKKDHLTKSSFKELFNKFGLNLTDDELDPLWVTFPLETDGTLSFYSLIEFCFMFQDKPSQPGKISSILQKYSQKLAQKSSEEGAPEKENITKPPTPPPAKVVKPPRSPSPKKEITKEETKIVSPEKKDDKADKTVSNILHTIKRRVTKRWDEIKAEFLALDSEGKTTVTTEQFKGVLQKHCRKLGDCDCDLLTNHFDRKNNGFVYYLDFLKTINPKLSTLHSRGSDIFNDYYQPKSIKVNGTPTSLSQQNALDVIVRKIRDKLISEWKGLRRSFRKIDLNSDGYLSVGEFRQALVDCGFDLNDDDFYHIFSSYDKNMQGKISYEEFINRSLAN